MDFTISNYDRDTSNPDLLTLKPLISTNPVEIYSIRKSKVGYFLYKVLLTDQYYSENPTRVMLF